MVLDGEHDLQENLGWKLPDKGLDLVPGGPVARHFRYHCGGDAKSLARW
jgi:hypothetical protein